MKKVPATLTLALLLAAAPALHAQEFYSQMLQRGISDSMRGAWDRAANELRTAAFGSITDMSQYQTAQIYLAVASDHLGRTAEAQAAAAKAVQVERITPVYASAPIDPATKQAFEQLLPKLLTAERYAGVPAFSRGRTTAVAQAMPQPAMPVPQPIVTTPVPSPAMPPPRIQPAMPAPLPRSMPAPVPPPVNRPAPQPVAPAPVVTRPVAAAPLPQPEPQRAVPVPAPQPQPQRAVQATPPPAPAPQPQPQPAAANQSPLVAAARRAPSQSSHFADFSARIAEAQRLLNEGKMLAARQAFVVVSRTPEAPRQAMLDAAKGLSQTDAWSDSSNVYAKLFPLQKGEEAHYFYEAVNRFELGEIATARDLLHRALPYVGNTREVAIYRARIEGTVQ